MRAVVCSSVTEDDSSPLCGITRGALTWNILLVSCSGTDASHWSTVLQRCGASKLLPTSCGRQQPDGHGGEVGRWGGYIKSAAVRWTTLALLLGFRFLITDPNSDHVSILGIRSQQRWGVKPVLPAANRNGKHWRTIRGFLFYFLFFIFLDVLSTSASLMD